MKYVIFKYGAGVYMPIMFPGHVTHSQVQVIDAVPVSAGFFRIENGYAVCFGKSTSLKLESNPRQDSELITMSLANMPVSFFIL